MRVCLLLALLQATDGPFLVNILETTHHDQEKTKYSVLHLFMTISISSIDIHNCCLA